MNRMNYLRILLTVPVVFVALVMLSCGGGSEYTLSVSVSPSGGGSVDPDGGAYKGDSEIIITAIPSEGFVFDRWSGDANGTSEKASITMDGNKSVTANFSRKDTVTLNIHQNPTDGGSVDPSGGKYETGVELTLTAIPSEKYSLETSSLMLTNGSTAIELGGY